MKFHINYILLAVTLVVSTKTFSADSSVLISSCDGNNTISNLVSIESKNYWDNADVYEMGKTSNYLLCYKIVRGIWPAILLSKERKRTKLELKLFSANSLIDEIDITKEDLSDREIIKSAFRSLFHKLKDNNYKLNNTNRVNWVAKYHKPDVARILNSQIKNNKPLEFEELIHSYIIENNYELVSKLLPHIERYDGDYQIENPHIRTLDKKHSLLGNNLIHTAVMSNFPDIFKLITDKYPDLSLQTSNGESVYDLLIKHADWQFTNVFLNKAGKGIATYADKLLLSLVKKEELANKTHGQGGFKQNTYQMDAKHNVVKTLLSHGANPNLELIDGYTLLQWTVLQQLPELTKSVLAANADVNKRNSQSGLSALHLASYMKSKEYLALLVKAKADINIKDNQGRTPLFFAFPNPSETLQQNHKLLINYLVDNGANPTLRDSTGLTASEFYGQRRNEFLVAKAKAEEAERRRLARVAEEKRLEKLRQEQAYIAQQKRRAKEKKAEHDAWMLGVAVVNTLANGYVDAMKQKAANDAAMQAIASQQQSYNDNVRANEQKRKQDTQQYKRDWEQQMSRAKADAAQRTAERESFQKQLMQSFNKLSNRNTVANNGNSHNSSSTYSEASSNKNSNNNSIKQDTRTKYVAKRVEINTTSSGSAWDTKDKAYNWLTAELSTNKLRRACDLTRVVPLDVQNITYRKTGSGRFHAKGTALGYCEISSSSSKYKNIGWCSTKGFNFSERHGCALPSPM